MAHPSRPGRARFPLKRKPVGEAHSCCPEKETLPEVTVTAGGISSSKLKIDRKPFAPLAPKRSVKIRSGALTEERRSPCPPRTRRESTSATSRGR